MSGPASGIGLRVDIARQRVARTAICTRANGTNWDIYKSSSLLVDPITQTAMILPYQLTPAWDETPLDFSKRYLRFGINGYERDAFGNLIQTGVADYETQSHAALPPDLWIENHRERTGNIYLENLGINYAVYTKTVWPKNRGFFLRLHVPQSADASKTAIEIGWGEVGIAGTVGLRVYGSGKVEVFKNFVTSSPATLVGTYSLGSIPDPNPARARNPDAGTLPAFAGGKLITLFLIPSRQRELLVFTSEGGGFSHTFADLDFSPAGQSVAQTITPAGRFWWHVVQGKASVQCAPLRFPTFGDALRRIDELRRVPPSGASFDILDAWDIPGYGTSSDVLYSLRDADNPVNPVTWNGTSQNRVRLRARLTGDGTNTPFLYAADARLLPGVANTNGANAEQIEDWVTDFDLSVGEDASGVSASVTLKIVKGVSKDPLPIEGAEYQYNRPVLIELDEKLLLTGTTGEVEIVEGKTDEAVRLSVPIRDLWAQLEAARFEDDIPAYDGFTLSDVIGDLLTLAGIPLAERDIEATTFTLDYAATCAAGEWSWQPKAGETVADWLTKLHSTFAPTWHMGFIPTATGPKFRFRSETTLSAAPAATVYLDREEVAGRRACYKFSEKTLPPEATRISVYGYDPAYRTFLTASSVDAALENPTTPPALRPEGWHGEVSPLVLVEPRLTTEDGVLRTRDELVASVGTSLRVAEWESTFLTKLDGTPLWKGDVVRIAGKGLYRILSLRLRWRRANGITDGGTEVARRTSYVGKWIGGD